MAPSSRRRPSGRLLSCPLRSPTPARRNPSLDSTTLVRSARALETRARMVTVTAPGLVTCPRAAVGPSLCHPQPLTPVCRWDSLCLQVRSALTHTMRAQTHAWHNAHRQCASKQQSLPAAASHAGLPLGLSVLPLPPELSSALCDRCILALPCTSLLASFLFARACDCFYPLSRKGCPLLEPCPPVSILLDGCAATPGCATLAPCHSSRWTHRGWIKESRIKLIHGWLPSQFSRGIDHGAIFFYASLRSAGNCSTRSVYLVLVN